MADSTNETTPEPVYIRYARLNFKFNAEKKKIEKLSALFSNKDNKISQERYDKIVKEAETKMADMAPEIESLKKEVDVELDSLKKFEAELKTKIQNIENQIDESKQLYSVQIIGKSDYEDELIRCHNELEPLSKELDKLKENISRIEKAINTESELPETESELPGKKAEPNPNQKPEHRPESTRPKGIINSIIGYFSNVKHSNNFIYRFLNTLLIIQGLCLLMFITFRFILLIEAYKALPIVAIGFLLLGIWIICLFLFMNVKPKPSAGTYFGLSVAYLGIAIVFFLQMGLTASSFDAFYADSLMGLMAFWNSVFSAFTFVIGCIRTFSLGIIYDYKKK